MKRDVIIVGGGPAGLTAALILGRCRRKTVLFDEGQPRNARSRGVNGFLGLDGIPPFELRVRARTELAHYPDVHLVDARVVAAARIEDGVAVTDANGNREEASVLLIATGLVDELPKVPGADRLYGRGIYTCPFCDGWEVRDQPLVVISSGSKGAELARSLTALSDDVVLVCHGGDPPKERERAALDRYGVRIIEDQVVAFESRDGEDENELQSVLLAGGERLVCSAAFVALGQRPASDLAARLGCEPSDQGRAPTEGKQRTCVSRVFVAGDAADDVELAIVAAAQGARAAQEIHQFLLQEEILGE